MRDAEAAVAQARVQLEREQAEAELARRDWEELGDGGEPSALLLRKPQLAQARAALEAAEAAVERARLNLARTRVTAPFEGRVRAKRADVGQSVSPGTPLADVYATEYAEVRLPVSKQDLAYLDVGVGWSADGGSGGGDGKGAEGPPVALHGDLAGATRSWTARVVRTDAEIDPQTRMLSVFARVDDPYRRDGASAAADGGAPPALPMGLFVEAEIAGRIAPAAAVLPRRALRTTTRSRDAEVLVADAGRHPPLPPRRRGARPTATRSSSPPAWPRASRWWCRASRRRRKACACAPPRRRRRPRWTGRRTTGAAS